MEMFKNIILILVFYVNLVYSNLEIQEMIQKEETFLNIQNNHTVLEINNIKRLKEFLNYTKTCFVEIFSPTCSHCVQFAPKYEEIAKMVNIFLIFSTKIK
jgi:hypothetical protein